MLERFFAFCDDAILLAHYVPFDLGIMSFARAREGKGVPRLAAIDTSILPKRLFHGAPNYALETLVKFLALPKTDAHRALPDAFATRDLFRRCVAAMGDPAVVTIGDVVKLAGPLLTFEQFSEIPYALPAELSVVDDAIARHVDLMVEYRGGSKGGVPRRVTPSHLFAKDGGLFLEGYCHLDGAPKSFRVDRIASATEITAAARRAGAAQPRQRALGEGAAGDGVGRACRRSRAGRSFQHLDPHPGRLRCPASERG